MKTKVFTDEKFNGKGMFKVYQVDENGEKAVEFDKQTGKKKTKKPIFNFGITKADILVKHAEELKDYQINENMKQGN